MEPYNSHWENIYNDEMVKLKDVCPDEILFVHHIGSTSVPFSDYLRRHNDVAHQYAEIKYQAAKACGNSSEIYCQLKSEFIRLHEKLALKELSTTDIKMHYVRGMQQPMCAKPLWIVYLKVLNVI
nr:GrpB family protein [Xenorhabdus poinarii]